jgi:hypothetical protein
MIVRLRNHQAFIAILSLFLALALLYGVAIPIFETPDANGHYAYIHELTEGRGLPVQGTPSGARVTGYVASHPPLYYALCAALTVGIPDDVDLAEWAWRNPYRAIGDPSRPVNKNRLVHTPAERFPWRGTPLTMHICRLVSTFLGALAVVATYGIALELFPERRWLALGASALAAFNPMFLFTSARVSNDAAVTAFGSLTIWGATRLATRGLSRRGLVLTGVALGLAALSKLSGVILAPAVALALAFDSLRIWQHRSKQPVRQRLGVIVGRWTLVVLPAMIVSGWWFVRNVVLYGELMGVDAWLSHTATVRAEPIGVLRVIPELRGLERSYWAMFGWFNIAVASWMYSTWYVLVRAAVVGLVLLLADQWTSRRLACQPQQGLLVLILAFLLNLGSVWRFIMIVLGAQGRYLMPTTASISILLMVGLSRLLPKRLSADHWRPALATSLGTAQLALAVISLFAFILPAYAKPSRVREADLPEDMTRLNVTFDGTPIQLLGGDIEAEELHTGGKVPLSLYWRATELPEDDSVAFIQILGRDMEPVAGVDCYPGRGNYPPTLWQPGVVYRDRYLLTLATNTEAPTVGALHAGLRSVGGGSLSSRVDQHPIDLVLLDLVPIHTSEPVSDEVTHKVGARLGEAITLVGYDLPAEHVRPGDKVSVTLVWRAEGEPRSDYTAFLHLMDEHGTLVSQSDHPPIDGAYPTSFWAPKQVVRDAHILTIDPSASPGRHLLVAGMYHSQTRDRLPSHIPGGEPSSGIRIEDKAIVVGQLIVQ